MEQAKQMLTRHEEEAEKVGLFCNAKKTELQVINRDTPVKVKVKSER